MDFEAQLHTLDRKMETKQIQTKEKQLPGSKIAYACSAYRRLTQLAQTLGVSGEVLAAPREGFENSLMLAEQTELQQRRNLDQKPSAELLEALKQFRIAYVACMAAAEAILPAVQKARRQKRQQARAPVQIRSQQLAGTDDTDFDLGPHPPPISQKVITLGNDAGPVDGSSEQDVPAIDFEEIEGTDTDEKVTDTDKRRTGRWTRFFSLLRLHRE